MFPKGMTTAPAERLFCKDAISGARSGSPAGAFDATGDGDLLPPVSCRAPLSRTSATCRSSVAAASIAERRR